MMNKYETNFINKLTPYGILKIFNNYIIKKDIIGMDNINNDSFKKSISRYSNHIVKTLSSYKFTPYMEKLILKSRNKAPRIISIPTIKDRIVLFALKEILHTAFPEAVNSELVNKRILDIHEVIKKANDFTILKFDIKNFYGSINQTILLEEINKELDNSFLLGIIDKSITNPTVPKKYSKSNKNEYIKYTGIPQGLAISNILANKYLLPFDKEISRECIYYYRYVDDILIICDSNKSKKLTDKCRNLLERRSLSLNLEKTKHFDKNEDFTFLGFKIDKNRICVKDETVQRFINSIFSLVAIYYRLYKNPQQREKWLTEELLIHRFESDLNEKITGAISENNKYGWLFYFSSITNTELLHKLNMIVQNAFDRKFKKENISIRIKSFVRAYYEIKNNPKGGYIKNYDIYDTISKKIEYLVFRGYLDNEKEYLEEEIDYIFLKNREKHINFMQKDIGSLS